MAETGDKLANSLALEIIGKSWIMDAIFAVNSERNLIPKELIFSGDSKS